MLIIFITTYRFHVYVLIIQSLFPCDDSALGGVGSSEMTKKGMKSSHHDPSRSNSRGSLSTGSATVPPWRATRRAAGAEVGTRNLPRENRMSAQNRSWASGVLTIFIVYTFTIALNLFPKYFFFFLNLHFLLEKYILFQRQPMNENSKQPIFLIIRWVSGSIQKLTEDLGQTKSIPHAPHNQQTTTPATSPGNTVSTCNFIVFFKSCNL